MSSTQNDNWTTCNRCESPRMIDPATGSPELCAVCQSMASPIAGALGTLSLVMGGVAIGALIGLAIAILL